MPTNVRTGALAGIDGIEVTAEVDLSRGLPGFHLVGLPAAEVRESRQRVVAALRNSGLKVPPGRITVNLAPAGLRKEGASYDLAIALGVLAAGGGRGGGALRRRADDTVFLGELSLFGEIRPVRGVLPIVTAAAAAGCRTAVVPVPQMGEAALVTGVTVHGADSLAQVAAWLRGEGELVVPPQAPPLPAAAAGRDRAAAHLAALDGQALARKAALIAVAGRHNLLLCGPPGAGKTRLARLIGALQPDLAATEALEVTRIHSAAGLLGGDTLLRTRPFRAPHHTTTRAGLVGGGGALRPGEATLAHLGVLFLDELPEFAPGALDALREPLEDGAVTVVRGYGRRVYPARFQLVAATNPCRCGLLGVAERECRCSPAERRRYLGRLSGPLLDRFDLFVEVGPWAGALPPGVWADDGDPAAPAAAGDWRQGAPWALLAAAHRALGEPPHLAAAAAHRLDDLGRRLGLSLRAAVRCRRVATTIAVLDGAARVEPRHVDEALEFRPAAVLTEIGAAGA